MKTAIRSVSEERETPLPVWETLNWKKFSGGLTGPRVVVVVGLVEEMPKKY